MSEKVCNCNCAENRKEQFKELQPVLDQYAKVPGSLITILQKAQDIYGYLSIDTINYISEATGIKPAKIYGVATFYAQFRLQPIGKYLVMLCQGTACHVNGSEMIEEAVCEHLNISTSRFSCVFKEATGKTFTEALNGIRMDRAKQLLRETSLKNYEIAEKVGFSDPHYFSIAFKKSTGLTPKEYSREK